MNIRTHFLQRWMTMLLICTCQAAIYAQVPLTSRYYVTQAEEHMQAKAWNEAKRDIDNGLAKYPDDPDLLYLNGRYYYTTGHLTDARYNLIKAIQNNDQHFRAKRLLVDVEDDTKHYSSAICYVNELLEFEPYDRDLWRRKIALYRKMNNNVEADAALERLARIYPNDTIVLGDLRQRHKTQMSNALQKNTLDEMANELEHWIDLDPNHLEYYLELIGIYQRMGEFERAIGAANRGLIHFPRNPQLVDKEVGILTDLGLYIQALQVAQKNEPHGKAYRYLLQEVAADARLRDPYDVHGRLYAETHDRDALTYLINTSLTRGYDEDARQYLKDAMQLDGRTPQLLMKQYALEKRAGNENTRRRLLQELYENQPDDEELKDEYTDMILELANMDLAQEQWADANLHLERAAGLMATDNEQWPATMSKRIVVAGRMGQYDEARRRYQQAAADDPANQPRYAAAYEDLMATHIRTLIEDEDFEGVLREGQALLSVLPKSEVALRSCINASQTLKHTERFYQYARQGYEAYPDNPYFIVKQAIALQQQGHPARALRLVTLTMTSDTDTYVNPQLISAYTGLSQEWAMELLKNHMPNIALSVVDSALVRDHDNRELLYTRGLICENLKKYGEAYYYQKRYYEPSNAEQPEYFQHMRYLRFRSLNNRIDATYTHAAYDTRSDALASRGHLYSVATMTYSRLLRHDTFTGQLSYKGIDGYHEDDEQEAGGVGLELMAQWDHTFNHRWSGMANISYSTKFFNKIGANVSASYAMDGGWTPSLRVGYRRTPESYLYLSAGSATEREHEKYHLFIVTPSVEKSWERIKTTLNVDLSMLKSSLYYNVGLKGKLFLGDDNITSVSLLTGFGSFPELTFFEQTALRNVAHTNAMVGFDAQYLCAENLYLGLAGTWNTCYDPYLTSEGKLKDSYRNIYALTLQLHVAF